MKRPTLHFVVDAGLALLGLGVLSTGLLLALVLPAGSRGDTVVGWTRHEWGDVHLYVALTLLALAAVHVTLNWAWVCNVLAKMTGRRPASVTGRRLAGLIFVIVLAGVLAAVLLLAEAVKVERDRGGRNAEDRRSHVTAMDADATDADVWRAARRSPR